MKHLLSIDELETDELRELLRITPSFAEVASRRIAKVPALRGQTVATLFYEYSTRTRLSSAVRLTRRWIRVVCATTAACPMIRVEDTHVHMAARSSSGAGVAARVSNNARLPSAGVIPSMIARW